MSEAPGRTQNGLDGMYSPGTEASARRTPKAPETTHVEKGKSSFEDTERVIPFLRGKNSRSKICSFSQPAGPRPPGAPARPGPPAAAAGLRRRDAPRALARGLGQLSLQPPAGAPTATRSPLGLAGARHAGLSFERENRFLKQDPQGHY